jgi:HEAT repeat protein
VDSNDAAEPAGDRDVNDRAARTAVATDAALLGARATDDPDPRVRAVAIAALVRVSSRRVSAPIWRRVVRDRDARVRLRAAEVAPRLGRAAASTVLIDLLHDADAWVAEAAAHAIGEHPAPTGYAISALASAATTHPDPLVREAAVAALGAQGDPTTLPAVLAACTDKPAIRRRAVLALAAFDGDEVESRLRIALTDADWQVRQAAEDLLHITS